MVLEVGADGAEVDAEATGYGGTRGGWGGGLGHAEAPGAVDSAFRSIESRGYYGSCVL